MKCPIVFASDSAYAMPLATALRSLVDSNKPHWPLEFYVINDGIPQFLQNKIKASLHPSSATINWVEIDLTPFAEMTTMAGISKMTFARLAIPKVIPDSVTRVLYMDSDTLTLGDLSPLFLENLGNAPFGAVLDGVDSLLRHGSPKCAGMPRVERYFNAGVLLIDLPEWRAHGISERALQYLERNPSTPFADQDALNVSGDKLWHSLNAQWNYQNHRESRIDELGPRPRIVHFVTGAKPWRAKSLNLNSRLYDSYRNRTAFSRTLRERCNDSFITLLSYVNRQLNRFTWWRKIRLQLRYRVSVPRPSSTS